MNLLGALRRIPLFPRSLLGRTVVLMALILIASQIAWFQLFRIYDAKPRVKSQTNQVANIVSVIQSTLDKVDPERHEEFLQEIEENQGIRVQWAPHARPGRPPVSPVLQELAKDLKLKLGKRAELLVHDGDEQTVLIKIRANDQDYWVEIPRARIERAFPWQWMGGIIFVLLLSIAGAFLIVWRISRPLKQLTGAAEQLGRGQIPQPLEEVGPNEIRTLSRTFNEMIGDLQRLDADRTLLLAGVSHDLRTPLARLRLAVEMLDETRDPVLKQGIIQDVEDMDLIIRQFLDFVREGSNEPSRPGDVNRLAIDVAKRFQRLGKTVATSLSPLPPVAYRPIALQRLVTNLIDNALRHGGTEVEVRTSHGNGTVILSVLDRGPGIPPGDVERLKQPFSRLDSARGGRAGSGLGLAIVDRIAKLHNAHLRLLPRLGGGLAAQVELPAADAPESPPENPDACDFSAAR